MRRKAALILVTLFGACLSCSAPPLPTDMELKTRFQEHRLDLDALARRACADVQFVGGTRVSHTFLAYVRGERYFNRKLSPDEVVSTGRIEYLRGLERVGLNAISREGGSPCRVWFVVRSTGRVHKGLVYSEQALKPTFTSLDGMGDRNDGQLVLGYLPLAPGWFLFVSEVD